MKKSNILISLSALILICFCIGLVSCRKKLIVTLPQVSLLSVTYFGLDSVIAQGRIASTGGDDITAQGFICSLNPDFNNYPAQTNGFGSPNFNAIIQATHYQTYYFKAFATNSKGTAYSNVIKYKVPAPPPATAPCTLANNFITDNGTGFGVLVYNSSNPTWGNYEVDFSGSNEMVYAYFYDQPHNGIYTTVADPSDISPGQVSVGITNFYLYTVDSGQKVYVALDSASQKTIITFCSLSYSFGGFTAYLSGKGSY